MRTHILATAFVIAAFGTAACRDAQTGEEVSTRTSTGDVSRSMSGDSADRRGVALVRVVNAVPDAGHVIVRADEAHALAAAAYGTVTPYETIDRNWVTFQVGTTDSGTFAPLATNREMLTDGFRYTIVVMRDSGTTGWETRILRDEIALDSANARVRVIHAARGIGEITVVRRGGATLFDGINFTSEAGFTTLPPWRGTLEVRTEDGNRLLHSIPNAVLEAGRSYTIVLTRSDTGRLRSFRFDDSQLR